MIKRFLITTTGIAVFLMTRTYAQETEGIHFEQKLKWSEILAKAKTAHKYIFVDCYATWCGPCKQMEQAVYPQKEVGEVYNKDFICVKMQMDKTAADDSLTKSRYKTAEMFERNYTVNAYPTFLFFDPDGKPVHKVSGAMDSKAFIQLAENAQNPDKQYYAILNHFQPGKLDTVEEKGLPLAFLNSDKKLATQIASDYLSRIPKSRLATYDSGRLMYLFQDDPQVSTIAAGYITSLGEGNYTKKTNLNFIIALSTQQKVIDVGVNYIRKLTYKEMLQPDNLCFMRYFSNSPEVHQIAQRFIAQLPDKDRYNKLMINFTDFFTDSPQDNGFRFFYNNAPRIDTVMSGFPHYAEIKVMHCIENAELAKAERTGVMPDFDKLEKKVTKNYDDWYDVKFDAETDWYSYQIQKKRQNAYWPQFLKICLDHDRQYFADKTAIRDITVNRDCWNAFLYIEDPTTLDLADSLIIRMLQNTPNDTSRFNTFDTYASLLYKSGKKDEAITTEEQALTKFDTVKHPVIASKYRAKIDAMKRNEKIWLDPRFQN
jgi:thioredoxin-related protein